MCRKKSYRTRREAKGAALWWRRCFSEVKAVYFCSVCHAHHIGGSTKLAVWLILTEKQKREIF